ncbi:GNAT family N-acetyltransferase [Aestuariibacter sp. AA17]|uniref:GNAT family N-acetyltransferase n=1 Tax=Fluctibacter corallii TaxID=2984329 RepID=A0ABT3AA23_9ALTE|nr:GNAT family N-acetyltransferase [Aestuariibacter sp. AA17]MCV2885166.1 GNAT family N-acetyltransferase [Aestuariibacter sp. AA17]
MAHPPPTIHFRQATLEDIPQLARCEQGVLSAERPFNETIKASDARYYDLPKLLSDPAVHVIVAEQDNIIIATGYIRIETSKQSLTHARHGYLGFMYVAPEMRGRGLNKDVISKLVDWAKQHNIHDFYLDVYSQNASAIRAYEKLGFRPALVEMKLHLSPDN